ncbi:MAG: BACON domain-containing protein [Alistipes sp.]|nr:BACON domain-containing protein [Alistipes sp.]
MIILSGMLFAACYQDADEVPVVVLGADADEYVVSQNRGEITVPVISDAEFTVSFVSDADWAEFVGFAGQRTAKIAGDRDVTIAYAENTGVSRYFDIELARGNRRQIVRIKQKGIYNNDILCPDRNILADWVQGERYARLLTLIPHDRIDISVVYDDGSDGWIVEYALMNNFFVFTAASNDTGAERSAAVMFSARNGWDEVCTECIRITQSPRDADYVAVSFADLRGMLNTAGSVVIDSNLMLAGRVVNDNSEGNGGPVPNLTVSLLDTAMADRTVFIQSEDGSSGVKVVFDSAADNNLRRYDAVTLCLRGMTLRRDGGGVDDPVRYTLEGAAECNVLSSSAGSAAAVVRKVRTINELTDEDMYTFVTLSDCEIPIRKGPFAPISQTFRNIMGTYPMVIRDRTGGTMYMMNNVSCDYARNGKMMPYGSGEVSGVVVHEPCDQFEWNISEAASMTAAGYLENQIFGIGNIGRYQIRPVSREDIALASDFADGFSEMICEFRWFNSDYDAISRNVDDNNHLWATYSAFSVGSGCQALDPIGRANGEMWHTDASHPITSRADHTYLGPVSATGGFADFTNGNGVYDASGNSAHFSITGTLATNGTIDTPNGSAWRHTYWYLANTFQAWTVRFSTAEIGSEHAPMSVQFGAIDCSSVSFGAPRYWKVQYSTDAASWNDIADYTVPDMIMATNRKFWQSPAFKYMSFTLPASADVWNKESVYIRLIPSSNRAGTQYAYDGTAIVPNRESALNYFAVRCNK